MLWFKKRVPPCKIKTEIKSDSMLIPLPKVVKSLVNTILLTFSKEKNSLN